MTTTNTIISYAPKCQAKIFKCPEIFFYGRYLFLILSCHADGQMILAESPQSLPCRFLQDNTSSIPPSLRTVDPTRESHRTSEPAPKDKHLLAVHFLLRTMSHDYSRVPRQASPMASFAGCAP